MGCRALALTAAFLALAPAARAQSDPPSISRGFDAHNFTPVGQDGDPRDLVTTFRAGRFEQGEVWGAALFDWASQPLVLVSHYSDGRPDVVQPYLDNVGTVSLDVGGAPLDFVEVEAAMPLYLTSTGPGGTSNGFDLGDLQLAVTAAILRPKPRFGGGIGLAVVPWVGFPLGNDKHFLGAGGFTYGGRVAATYELGAFTFTADAGPHFTPKYTALNQTGSGALQVGGGVGYLVLENLGVNLEARTSQPFAKNDFTGTAAPTELLANVRGTLHGFHFVAGGGMGLSRGAGAARWRAFAGGGWGRVEFASGDRDGDGIPDDKDLCPKQKEVVNRYEDTDGCPDDGGRAMVTVELSGLVETDVPVRLTDGTHHWTVDSGLEPVPLELPAGAYDATADYPGYAANATFVVTANDTPVKLELVEVEPGTISIDLSRPDGGSLDKVGLSVIGDGAPPGSQVLGPNGLAQMQLPPGKFLVYLLTGDGAVFRKYVRIHSDEDTHVHAVLRNPRATITASEIQVTDKIYFETDSANIEAESDDLLEEIGTLLIANPQVKQVEIEGFTDDQGTADYNLKLSQDRADGVRTYLIRVGVDPNRLTARGYGETNPIATNRTEAGRAINRRVEFVITQRE